MTFREYLQENKDGTVNITPEVSYKIRDVIKRDIRLQNSKFADPYFPDGQEKPFVNPGFIVERTVNANTDFDTANFDCFAKNKESIPLNGMMKAVLKNYLSYSNYANFLNESGEQLVRDGHVILKKCADGSVRAVNLLNVVRPAHIEGLSGGIAEECHYTWGELKTYKDSVSRKDWETIRKTKEYYEKGGVIKDFVVYEWWREGEFEGKQTIFCEKHFLVEGTDDANPNAIETGSTNTIKIDEFETPYFEKIHKKAELIKLKKAGIAQGNKKPIFPYIEKQLFRIPGRWKGMGYYELLATLIELYNFTWGQKVRNDEMSRQSVIVYKRSDSHQDTMLTDEWLNRIDTGGIFNIWNDEDVHDLNIASRTAEFLTSLDKIFELIRLMSGVTSQRAGGGTDNPNSATEVMRDEKVADTTFEYVKERKGLLYKELFEKFEVEDMIKDLTEEDAVALMGDKEELERIEEPYIRNYIRAEINNNPTPVFEKFGITNKFPKEEENQLVKAMQIVRGQGTRFVEFKKEIIKNVNLGFEFYVYGESLSKAQELQAIQDAINTVIQIPTTNISADSLVKKKLDMVGIRSTDMEKTQEELQRETQMAQMQQMAQPVKAQ